MSPALTLAPTRIELSGASAVTFLVLLLLLGGVDSRAAEAFGRTDAWACGGVVQEDVRCPTDREVRVDRHLNGRAAGTRALRLAIRGVFPSRLVGTAMLPRPRAPDDDRVR